MVHGVETAGLTDLLHVPDCDDDPLAGWILDQGFLGEAMRRAACVRIVSFDVFDTALTRLLDSPVDAFAEIERRLADRLGPVAGGYAQARVDAECEARLLHARLGGAEEVDLCAILDSLGRRMPALAAHLQAVEAMELEVERSLLVAVPDILELTRRLQAAGRPYMFVSDMYLPAQAIAGFLQHAGYSGWQALHVSSQTGATKASGRQWQVIRRNPEAAGRILHIGDDAHADGQGPKAHGIETLLYERARSERRAGGVLRPATLAFSRAQRSAVLSQRALSPLLSPDPAPDLAERWRAIGRVLGGIVVGSFLRWLEARVRLHRVEKLYFCARDGWLIQRAWKAAGLDRATGIEDHYLCVSRRPLNLARGYVQSTPGRLPASLLAFLSSTDGNTTNRAALARIGLSEVPEILADLDAHQVRLDEKLLWPDGVAVFQAMLGRHSALVHERLRRSHHELTAYLRQERFGIGGRCAIVDMGWHGSMQRSMRTLIEAERGPTKLVGFYYGLWPDAGGNRYGAGVMESAFASDFISGEEQAEVHEAVEILEELHGAPHGTVESYREAGGTWQPVFADSAAELRQYETTTRHFQDGTLESIAALFASGRAGALRLADLTRDAARAALGAVCLSPNAEELSLFGNLGHCATFDHARFDTLIPPGCPDDETSMRQALERSGWRAGTLRAWQRDALAAGDAAWCERLARLAHDSKARGFTP